jgi:hypothetical protein
MTQPFEGYEGIRIQTLASASPDFPVEQDTDLWPNSPNRGVLPLCVPN